jgi:DAK2 domain fusion protein YloV
VAELVGFDKLEDCVVYCKGQGLKHLLESGLAWLDHNHQSVNALNVFPVPDGDTGTNMLLTMRSAYEEVADEDLDHVGRVAQRIAHGALMGARGNSGVILSQIWRGFARKLEELPSFDCQQFAAAMREASETAYKGVVKPVEGTILTVIRQAAEMAEIVAQSEEDLGVMFAQVVNRCHQAVAETPRLLKVLADAGVVDAGGQGLALILEGMVHYMRGEAIGVVAEPVLEALAVAPAPHTGAEEYNYDVQFIIKGQDLDVAAIRDAIDGMGDSTLVVGDASVIKVHVHVDDPGLPISYGVTKGSLLDVVVENMQAQYEQFSQATATTNSVPLLAIQKHDLIPGQIAAVAVAPGPGIADVFESLGVSRNVAGGQTMNPSTEEILAAVESVGTDKVVVLPNNKNIIMAAESACEMTSKQCRVIRTRNVPQGVNALLSLDPDGELDQVADAMAVASETVATGEITTATRDVMMSGVQVKDGHILGLSNGEICSAGPDMEMVIRETLDKMDVGNRELLTFYYGAEVSPQEAQEMAAKAQEWYPEVEIEVVDGGQPHYFYIISAE